MILLKKLNSGGITVIMVDHEMERVAKYADRVMVLDKGQVIAIDHPWQNLWGS